MKKSELSGELLRKYLHSKFLIFSAFDWEKLKKKCAKWDYLQRNGVSNVCFYVSKYNISLRKYKGAQIVCETDFYLNHQFTTEEVRVYEYRKTPH